MDLSHRHEPQPPTHFLLTAAFAALTLLAAPTGSVAQEPAPAPDAPETLPAEPSPRPMAPIPLQEGGFLGVAIEDVDKEQAGELGLSKVRGALITDVLEDSPASDAGIQEADLVLDWDGQSVRSALHLRRLVRETPPGRTVSATVLRDGERREMDITVAERPGPADHIGMMDEEDRRGIEAWMEEVREHTRRAREHARHEAREARKARDEARKVRMKAVRMAARPGPRIGVRLFALNDQLAEYFGLEDGDGALVVRVHEDSPAGRAGLRAGDVIVSVAGSEVGSPSDAVRLIGDADGETVQIAVLRRGERRTFSVEIPEHPESGRPERAGGVGPDLEVLLEDLEPRLRHLRPLLLRGLEGNRLII